jgi:hypothetical protein
MEQVLIQETHKSPDEPLALERRNHQLLTLVGELLRTNQELRFKSGGAGTAGGERGLCA